MPTEPDELAGWTELRDSAGQVTGYKLSLTIEELDQEAFDEQRKKLEQVQSILRSRDTSQHPHPLNP